jgi:hypothetical protein
MKMNWSSWKKIAIWDGYYKENLPDYTGPAIYQLGLGDPQGGSKKNKYLGKAKNLYTRILPYSRDNSHLYEVIVPNLRKGYALYYRYYKVRDPSLLLQIEKAHLLKENYDWNIQNNS